MVSSLLPWVQASLPSHLKKFNWWLRPLFIWQFCFIFTKHSPLAPLPPSYYSPSSSSSHSTCFSHCVLFSVWSSFLVPCLGNPIFLVGLGMMDRFFHDTHPKELGNPKFIQNITLCNETHYEDTKIPYLKMWALKKNHVSYYKAILLDVMGGGFNKRILGGIYPYIVKLGVFFNIPWMKVLCYRFIEWRPRGKFRDP